MNAQEILERLVRIPSVNPEESGDDGIKGEARMADAVEEVLSRSGFACERDEVKPGRPNLLGFCGPEDPVRTILIEGHLDTVGVEGMTVDPFTPVARDGKLYGRGACDTKGPTAAALAALTPERMRRLSDAGVCVRFLGAMGEEKGNDGAIHYAQRGNYSDETIVLEPTDLAVVRAHKGALFVRSETLGRAGHGSNPAGGVNAVQGMVSIVQRLNALLKQHQSVYNDALLKTPTMNIGVIEGGVALNTIPERCRLEFDWRTVPGEDHAALRDEMRRLFEAEKETGGIRDYTLMFRADRAPFVTPEDGDLVQRMDRVIRDCCGTSRISGIAGYTDAGPLSEVSGQTIVFGPGGMDKAHTADEFIELESLEKGAAVMGAYLDQAAEELKP